MTQFLAVAGRPVLHSLSPRIFNFIFSRYSLDAHYTRICGENFRQVEKLFHSLGFLAINVTSPFKKDAFNFADNLEFMAKKTGAVNALMRSPGGIYGLNTDVLGVAESLRPHITELHISCLVLGTGGAAAAAVMGAKLMKLEVTITGRNPEKLIETASLFKKVNTLDFNRLSESASQFDIIVNTIPEPENHIDFQKLPGKLIFLNATYHKEKHHPKINYISGIEWLKNQAVPFYNILMDKCDEHRPDLPENLHLGLNFKNIILHGFMGAGKSSVAKHLAKLRKMEFIDTDELTISKTGKSIPEIFRESGEEKFREIESGIIQSISSASNAVIAAGGGALLSKGNRELFGKSRPEPYDLPGFERIIFRHGG
jgi:shikimate dehydrogenase